MSTGSSGVGHVADKAEMTSESGAQKKKTRAKKFMFLKVGDNTYALPLNCVREVLGLGQISTLPNMPEYFAGLINLRGKIISAVYLEKSLNFNLTCRNPRTLPQTVCDYHRSRVEECLELSSMMLSRF